ncbi:hypothetical protein BOTBODRAFT_180725 [Botryobasidium botryosum FD-172 SS1]|uniref:Uncharacterized protein n=1 Tax=Botryobasidium botryosum (strain FD-172 SS1) TaxID=930990 RepID=A0A067M798_BOTB1|nr:hypothetical protein BOTBODRAFT_180725 [Botryobasidium botryosum FD-172 SS1]
MACTMIELLPLCPASSPGDGLLSTFWGRLAPVPSGFEWATVPVMPNTNLLRDTIAYAALDDYILTPFELRELIATLPQTPLWLSWGDAYNNYCRLHTANRHFTRSVAAHRHPCPRLPSSQPGPSSQGHLF